MKQVTFLYQALKLEVSQNGEEVLSKIGTWTILKHNYQKLILTNRVSLALITALANHFDNLFLNRPEWDYLLFLKIKEFGEKYNIRKLIEL